MAGGRGLFERGRQKLSLVSEEGFKKMGDLEAEWFDGAGEIGHPEYQGTVLEMTEP